MRLPILYQVYQAAAHCKTLCYESGSAPATCVVCDYLWLCAACHVRRHLLRTSGTNLEDVVLYLKELGLTDVLDVDFLDPPEKYGLVAACKQLFLLGALDPVGQITQLGKQMAKVPVEPALARALLAAIAGDVLTEVATVVALLGCEEGGGVFIRPGEAKVRREADVARAHFARDGLGDHVALLRCCASQASLLRSGVPTPTER